MKKLIMSLVVIGACRTSVSTTTTSTMGPVTSPSSSSTAVASVQPNQPNQHGATDAISAVRGFMAAAKVTDLNTMGGLWGDNQGPAREKMGRDELEKRELYMIRCLRNDRYEIAGDAPALNGARVMVLSLNYGELSRSADIQVVRGPADRWYVKDVNLPKLQDICMSRG